jgi:hypothetical protein
VTNRNELQIMPVLHWTEWEVKSVKPCSPLALFVGNDNKALDHWPRGMHGRVQVAAKPLLTYAAQKGFWQIGGKLLNQICVEVDLPQRAKPKSLGDKLFALIKFILKCTDDKVSLILEDRIASAEKAVERAEQEYVSVPGAARGMSADGKEELEEFQERLQTKKAARASIAKKLQELNE